MNEQGKKRQRIYDLLNAETNKNISKIIDVTLRPPSIPDHNPVDYGIWGVLENKRNAIPLQISVRLRFLLRWNGVKCSKNLFLRHNRFEGVLIQ